MTIYIPETIRVGYNNRSDTYTGKLAYVIYYGQDGKIRKELSWDNWRNKGIEPDEYDNTPLDGFVLNKKVGGHSNGWNHRNSYLRVYDPRGFEFEITPENLVYILENANSIKGKGLEGEFVYGWDGKDLLLIPTSSPDYQEINKHSKLMRNPQKINSKNIVLGGTYKTNKGEDWIYIGRFDYYEYYREYFGRFNSSYTEKSRNKGLYYWFYFNDRFCQIKSLSNRIIECVSDVCVSNYAEIADKLQYNADFSPVVKQELYKFTLEELAYLLSKNAYRLLPKMVIKYSDDGLVVHGIEDIVLPQHLASYHNQNLGNFIYLVIRDSVVNGIYNQERICALLETVYNMYDIWVYCNVLENGKIEGGWIK